MTLDETEICQYPSSLRWWNGSASSMWYNIVHIGFFERHARHYMVDIVKKLQRKFPHGRSTYYELFFTIPPYRRQEDDLMQQAKNLLRELQNLDTRQNIFVCWGMAGGIVFKQMILLSFEHFDDKDDQDDWLLRRTSGVLFLGCIHDEKGDNFRNRALWSLMAEANSGWNCGDPTIGGDSSWCVDRDAVAWEPVIDRVESITAEYGTYHHGCPVRTYYERNPTWINRHEQSGKCTDFSKILCPKESRELATSSFRAKAMKLDHEEMCWILHSNEFLVDFMYDAREMVRDYEDKAWPVPLIFEPNTRVILRTTVSEDPEFLWTTDPTKDLKRKRSDEDHEATSRRPVSTDREVNHEYSPVPLSQLQTLIPGLNEFTIGWICALSFEKSAAEAMLDKEYQSPSRVKNGSVLFTLGCVGPHKVVVACLPKGQPGLSSAAVVAREMLSTFPRIEFGFMVGIGGGVPSDEHDIRLGDVVVSQPHDKHGGVVQYDMGKSEESGWHPTGHLTGPPSYLLSVLGQVQTNHDQNDRTYPLHMARFDDGKRNMKPFTLPRGKRDLLFRGNYPHIQGKSDCRHCDLHQTVQRPERDTSDVFVKIHHGTIASGNRVVKSAHQRDNIVEELGGNILCFEMEAAGLMNNFPCLVIRGISDYCDSHKNDAWQRYAAGNAAAFTRELLLLIPPEDTVE